MRLLLTVERSGTLGLCFARKSLEYSSLAVYRKD